MNEYFPLPLAFLMLEVAKATIVTILASTFWKEAASTALPNKMSKRAQRGQISKRNR
jgi:hypothetical protein